MYSLAGGGGSRKARCMNCPACTQPDCRVCKYCLDMKKYGGPGVKKQSCELRPKCQGKDKLSENKSTTAKRKLRNVSNADSRCWSDLDDVDSSEEHLDDQVTDSYITSKETQNVVNTSEYSDVTNCAKISQQSSEDESHSANSESLKCNNCEFIAKTDTGLKKHKIRYHRPNHSSTDENEAEIVEETNIKIISKRKCLDNWQINCKKSDSGLKRQKANGIIDINK